MSASSNSWPFGTEHHLMVAHAVTNVGTDRAQPVRMGPRCTSAKTRRVERWVHEGVLDAMQQRLDRMPEAMMIRRQTVAHPFGMLKAWMGATHFLICTLAKVRTEMSLQVLACNMKRMIWRPETGPVSRR